MAFWPRALRNFPLAIDKFGNPIYGPEVLLCNALSCTHYVEFYQLIYINGKLLERKGTDQIKQQLGGKRPFSPFFF